VVPDEMDVGAGAAILLDREGFGIRETEEEEEVEEEGLAREREACCLDDGEPVTAVSVNVSVAVHTRLCWR
jgi:hypothetical protein